MQESEVSPILKKAVDLIESQDRMIVMLTARCKLLEEMRDLHRQIIFEKNEIIKLQDEHISALKEK